MPYGHRIAELIIGGAHCAREIPARFGRKPPIHCRHPHQQERRIRVKRVLRWFSRRSACQQDRERKTRQALEKTGQLAASGDIDTGKSPSLNDREPRTRRRVTNALAARSGLNPGPYTSRVSAGEPGHGASADTSTAEQVGLPGSADFHCGWGRGPRATEQGGRR